MKAEIKRQIKAIGWMLFIIYLILLLYFLFFSEGYGRREVSESDYRYNLELFKEISRFWNYREQLGAGAVGLNLLGNIIGFLPLGFILPIISIGMRHICLSGIVGFLVSLFVESCQLIGKVGCFDVDDLLLNTLGTVIGYCLFYISNRIRRWICEKKI